MEHTINDWHSAVHQWSGTQTYPSTVVTLCMESIDYTPTSLAVAPVISHDRYRTFAEMSPRGMTTATSRHLIALPPGRELLPDRIHRAEQVE